MTLSTAGGAGLKTIGFGIGMCRLCSGACATIIHSSQAVFRQTFMATKSMVIFTPRLTKRLKSIWALAARPASAGTGRDRGTIRLTPSRSDWVSWAIAGLAVGLPLTCAPPAGAAPRQTPVLLAVWGLADGNSPVGQATVRVYAGAPRRLSHSGTMTGEAALPEIRGFRERTSPTGVAVLEFKRLPSQFTVALVGGRVDGRRLPGLFRAPVRNYRSGTVVYVNPVTTLIADDVAAGSRPARPSALVDAKQRIYRLLGIPGWQDNAALSYSDRYFDGDAYLSAANRAGGIAALNRILVSEALHRHSSERFLAGVRRNARGPDPDASTASLVAVAGGSLVKEVFKALAIQAGKSLAGLAAQKGGTAALGWLLAAFGYSDVLKDQEVLAIRHLVEALGKQLTQLQGQVALAGFSTLVHQTDRTIGQIGHATDQLALLANMPANDPTKRAFTTTIVDYIGENLLDAPSILNQGLGSNVPLADNVIKSASRLVAKLGSRLQTLPRSKASTLTSLPTRSAGGAAPGVHHAKPDVYSATNAKPTWKSLRATSTLKRPSGLPYGSGNSDAYASGSKSCRCRGELQCLGEFSYCQFRKVDA